MGIHDTENAGNNNAGGNTNERDAFNTAGIGVQGTGAAEQVQPARRASSSDVTAANLGSRFKRSFSASTGNLVVKEFLNAFTEIAKEQLKPNADVQYRIESLDDSDSPDAPVGSVLFIGYFKDGRDQPTALVFTMPVDGSAPSVLSRPYEVPGTNRVINVSLPVSSYVTETYWGLIVDKLQGVMGAGYEFISVGSADLPNTLKADKDTAQLREMARLGFGAIDTFIERNYVDQPELLRVENITNRATTQVYLDLNDAPVIGANGLPIRKDISLTLRSAVRSAIQGMPDKQVDVISVGGFINLAYYQPPLPQNRDQRPDTRRFIPQMILTSITPSRETNIVTPETQILGLGLVPNLAVHDQWMAPMLPMATQGNSGRDFGAVGYEVNFSGQENGQPVGKEDMSKLTTAEQFEMIRMSVFTDELHVALLVDESSPYGWINAMFRDAANPAMPAAYDDVVKATDTLTGGIFSKLWDAMGRPAISQVTDMVLHTGYYIDSDTSEKRDLLDIDYLWMLNRAGNQNLERVFAFGDTLLGNGDPIERLQQRWDIIQKLVPSAVMTGQAQVVEISPDYLKALVTALKQAKLNMRPANSLVDFTNAAGRASYGGGMGHGLDQRGITETLQQGYGNTARQGGQTFFGGGLNNWRR